MAFPEMLRMQIPSFGSPTDDGGDYIQEDCEPPKPVLHRTTSNPAYHYSYKPSERYHSEGSHRSVLRGILRGHPGVQSQPNYAHKDVGNGEPQCTIVKGFRNRHGHK